ncbi:MAG TPA: DUF1800 domain-containing protein [Longimicrobiales bacterium]
MRNIAGLTLCLVLLGPVAHVQAQSREAHLLSRATYGARPQDVAHVRSLGIEKWLDQQLAPQRIDDTRAEQALAQYEGLRMSFTELSEMYAPNGQGEKRPQQLLQELVGAKLTRAAYSERQLEEVMTDFWFNHFNVFFGDGPVRYLVADYEQKAIRAHVFGKFYDMLRATAQHPAMLVYLDNAMSNSRRGVNENYARELLELHTLGVDGGYAEEDVREIARAFTGWTVVRAARAGAMANRRNGEPGSFQFVRQLHDDGEKVVLGKKLAAGRGIQDGEDVLRMLAAHPSTAKFIATKLVQRFVNDDPPADFVNELATVFTKTEGDLRAVTRALFTSKRFYEARHYGAKVKTPFELVASALRATDAEFRMTPQLAQTLRSLGQLPYTETAPTGFPAASDEWVNSGAMLNRINFGIALANNRMNGVRTNWDATRGDAARVLGSPEFQRR